jgi:hypothetical protein
MAELGRNERIDEPRGARRDTRRLDAQRSEEPSPGKIASSGAMPGITSLLSACDAWK